MCENHREDKFLRATKLRYCTGEEKAKNKQTNTPKKRKKMKALSVSVAIAIAVAILIVPTTTLAPDADAFEDSKAASLSVGDINDFAVLITDNCFVAETTPVIQETTSEAVKTTSKQTTKPEETTKSEEKTTQAEKTEPEKATQAKAEVSQTEAVEVSETEYEYVAETTESSKAESVETTEAYQSGYLMSISKPDKSYSPKAVSLSSYDRAKLERLVMGEAGSMGYTGCALVAQAVRDAMNRSNTTSIDRIISEYQYYAPTNKEPNADVKNAVSFIFDQNGSAVQHRVLCFYTGTSGWHETQNFVTSYANVRFFDLWY